MAVLPIWTSLHRFYEIRDLGAKLTADSRPLPGPSRNLRFLEGYYLTGYLCPSATIPKDDKNGKMFFGLEKIIGGNRGQSAF